MKKICIALVLMLILSSCGESVAWVAYTFDDSDSKIRFSLEYPSDWTLVEQRGWEGDETREASPDSGIRFDFSGDGAETFSIAAMRFSPLTWNKKASTATEFMTDQDLAGTRYSAAEGERVEVLYLFGTEELPQYFAFVNMSATVYESRQEEIERVMKSFQILSQSKG